MRELRVAKTAGFCFGVSRSVDMAEKLLAEEGHCLSLGQLIHNEDVVNALKEKGMRVVETPEAVRAGERVLVRAHGAAPEVYTALEQAGAEIYDATCPKVRAIHKIAAKAKEEGRFTIVIGMRAHPEVNAICGWCGDHVVLENAEEVKKWLNNHFLFFLTFYW